MAICCRGGTPGNSWWGCAAWFSKSRPYFRPKNVIFHTRFQTWPLRNYVIITYIRKATKTISKNPFRIFMFLFLSYSFGIETINTFVPATAVPLKTIPGSRPKWAKSIPAFRPKRRKTPGKNPTRWGGTYLYGLYREVPPLPPARGGLLMAVNRVRLLQK